MQFQCGQGLISVMIRFELHSACFYFLQVNNQWQKLGGTSGEGEDLAVHTIEIGQYAEDDCIEIGGKEDVQMQKVGEKTSVVSPTVSDETNRGMLVKGEPKAGVFKRERDETVCGLKQKDDATADSSEKGGENGSNLKKEDDRGGEATGGLKEAGDQDSSKTTGGCLEKREAAGVKKDDQAVRGSNETGKEYGGSGKEMVDESVCTSKDESNVSAGGLKKSDQGADGSKEKRNETAAIATNSLKEKEDEVIDGAMKNGDEIAVGSNDEDKGASGPKEKDEAVSGSGEKVVTRGPGGASGGEAVDSSNQNSDKSGNDNDEWTTSSNGNQAEDTIVVVLHAFIQPDAWDIDSKDIQYDVHVRSEYMKWKTNCATVTVRYVGVIQCLYFPYTGQHCYIFVQMSWQHLWEIISCVCHTYRNHVRIS